MTVSFDNCQSYDYFLSYLDFIDKALFTSYTYNGLSDIRLTALVVTGLDRSYIKLMLSKIRYVLPKSRRLALFSLQLDFISHSHPDILSILYRVLPFSFTASTTKRL